MASKVNARRLVSWEPLRGTHFPARASGEAPGRYGLFYEFWRIGLKKKKRKRWEWLSVKGNGVYAGKPHRI